MKKHQTILPLILALTALLAIGGVVTTGILKSKPKTEVKKGENSNVLGQMGRELTSSPADINQLAQEALVTTKETVSQKIEEVKNSLLKEIEKEAAKLTQSQVESLKYNLCRDWGVVTAIPTKEP